MDLRESVRSLSDGRNPLYLKDFLRTWEQPRQVVEAVVHIATRLKELHREGRDLTLFTSGLAISNFRDKSTRTRFSFASAANVVGLSVSDFDESKSQVAHGETVRETAVMLSFLAEVVGIRDDIYLGLGHKYQEEFGAALTESYEMGILPRRPSIINLQCDLDHPTQSLSDLAHLVNYFGGLENLRGRKIAMTWAYSPSYGKPLSVAQGIVGLLSRFGVELVLAYPEGYDLLPEVTEFAAKAAEESGGSFTITHSMEEAFREADVVYPKSWAPMWVMEERVRIFQQGGTYEELEKAALEENAKHMDWEANEKLMELTRDGEALYMHCLPADISGVSCEHGEVSRGVFEKYRLRTYEEASYKPYVIAAMMILTRFEDPWKVLRMLEERTGGYFV